jgi:hypothetical protein
VLLLFDSSGIGDVTDADTNPGCLAGFASSGAVELERSNDVDGDATDCGLTWDGDGDGAETGGSSPSISSSLSGAELAGRLGVRGLGCESST